MQRQVRRLRGSTPPPMQYSGAARVCNPKHIGKRTSAASRDFPHLFVLACFSGTLCDRRHTTAHARLPETALPRSTSEPSGSIRHTSCQRLCCRFLAVARAVQLSEADQRQQCGYRARSHPCAVPWTPQSLPAQLWQGLPRPWLAETLQVSSSPLCCAVLCRCSGLWPLRGGRLRHR